MRPTRRGIQLLALLFSLQFAFHASAAETNAFIAAGMPSPNRGWAGFEYTLAAKLLTSGKTPLPRLSDAAGSNVFARITSTNNFASLQNKAIPIQSRVVDCGMMLTASGGILKAYLQAFPKDQLLHTELADLEIFILRLTAAGIQVMDEYIPQIPKDEKYQTRMEGLAKVKSGATTTFAGAMYSVTRPDEFLARDRRKIIRAMAETLPTLKGVFAESYIAELKVSLQRSRSVLKDPDDLRSVETMLKTLR